MFKWLKKIFQSKDSKDSKEPGLKAKDYSDAQDLPYTSETENYFADDTTTLAEEAERARSEVENAMRIAERGDKVVYGSVAGLAQGIPDKVDRTPLSSELGTDVTHVPDRVYTQNSQYTHMPMGKPLTGYESEAELRSAVGHINDRIYTASHFSPHMHRSPGQIPDIIYTTARDMQPRQPQPVQYDSHIGQKPRAMQFSKSSAAPVSHQGRLNCLPEVFVRQLQQLEGVSVNIAKRDGQGQIEQVIMTHQNRDKVTIDFKQDEDGNYIANAKTNTAFMEKAKELFVQAQTAPKTSPRKPKSH